MIKLIASDLDGTLLNSSRKLNPEFNKVLNEIKENNIKFVAVSGRDLNSVKNVFKDVKGEIIYASNNGNYIVHKDEVIFENYIEKEKLTKVADIVRKYAKHNTIYFSNNQGYTESMLPKIVGIRFGQKIKFVRDITKLDEKILKVSTFGQSEKVIEKALNEMMSLKDEVMVTPSGKTCFDVCRYGGTKKQGIKMLQKKFGVSFEETMVFGDHLNDLEMMESAFHSYAMQNAKEEVKNNARFLAKTNDENGVLEVIKSKVLKKVQFTKTYFFIILK